MKYFFNVSKQLKNTSYRFKIFSIVGSLFLTFLLYALFNFLFISNIKSEINNSIDKNIVNISSAIIHSIQDGISTGNIDNSKQSLSAILEANENILGVQVYKNSNHIEFSFGTATETALTRSIIKYIPSSNNTSNNVQSFSSKNTQPYITKIVYVRPEIIEEDSLGIKLLILTLATSIVFILILFANLKMSSIVANSITDVELFLKKIKENDASISNFSSKSRTINKIFVEFLKAIDAHKESYTKMELTIQDRNIELEENRKILEKQNLEKRNLINRLNDIAESERKMISVEIHDQLNASLILINLEAHNIQNKLRKIHDSEEIRSISASSKNILYRATALHEQARNIVKSLHPEMLDVLGIQAAIDELVKSFNTVQEECHFTFKSIGNYVDMPTSLALACFRLTQESTSNVLKHALASKCIIELIIIKEQESDQEFIQLAIHDNGKGFNLNTTTKGLGLIGMRERVENLDGSIVFDSKEGSGTNVLIKLPINRSQWGTSQFVYKL